MLDRDVDAVIATHARDQRVAAWLHDTAQALAEIDQIDLAIDWAQRAADFPDRGHQAAAAAEYWCTLLADHHPQRLLQARRTVFDRWPSASTAARLHHAAGDRWPELQHHVLNMLSARPHDAVTFTQHTLSDLPLAWQLAHTLDLADHRTWHELTKAYEHLDPTATLPVHTRLAQQSSPRPTPPPTATPPDDSPACEHRRRPRLHSEFARAGLPKTPAHASGRPASSRAAPAGEPPS